MSVYTAFGFRNLGNLSVVSDFGSYIRVSINESLVIGFNSAPAFEGKRNTILGYESGIGATTGDDNIMLGFRTGFINKGHRNTFVGSFAGFTNREGADNVFIGVNTADNNSVGRYNVMVGNFARHTTASDGSNNVIVGHNSITSGDNNIILGARNVNISRDSFMVGYQLSNNSNDQCINILNRIVGKFERNSSNPSLSNYVLRFSDCTVETDTINETLLKGLAVFKNGAKFTNDCNLGYWNINMVPAGSNNWDLRFQSANDTVVTFTDAFEAGSLNFTGKHRCSFVGSPDDYFPGCIVVSTGTYADLREDAPAIDIDESLPVVGISKIDQDPRAFGVVASCERLEDPVRTVGLGNVQFGFSKITTSRQKLIVNGCGEGALWVCDAGGPFQNGDLVQTCAAVPGMGARQPDRVISSHTVAKVTCDCDFDLQSERYKCYELPGGTRVAFVGCVYKCS